MRYDFPASLTKDKSGGFLVSFSDLEGCYTDGKTLSEALDNAKDVLNLMLWDMEERGANIPQASQPDTIRLKKNSFVTFISADTLEYRKKYDKKAVKKTLSIPRWLDTLATEQNVNFSHVLQNALMKELNV